MSAREGMSVDEALAYAFAWAHVLDQPALSTLAAEVLSLRGLCAAAYQAASASDWPVEWLDNFSDAANGDPLRHEPMSLLPFASPAPVPDEPEGITGSAIKIDGQDVYLPTWCAERVRKALEAPVFDMERSQPLAVPEAAVEAAMGAYFGNHIMSLDPDTSGMRDALTAALPFLGASAACDDIQPDMEALRRDGVLLDWLFENPLEALDIIGRHRQSDKPFVRQTIDAALAAQAGKQGDMQQQGAAVAPSCGGG